MTNVQARMTKEAPMSKIPKDRFVRIDRCHYEVQSALERAFENWEF